jgi:hypothetical protein
MEEIAARVLAQAFLLYMNPLSSREISESTSQINLLLLQLCEVYTYLSMYHRTIIAGYAKCVNVPASPIFVALYQYDIIAKEQDEKGAKCKGVYVK